MLHARRCSEYFAKNNSWNPQNDPSMLDAIISPVLQMRKLRHSMVPRISSSNSARLAPGFKPTLLKRSPKPKGLCHAWNFLLSKDCGCRNPKLPSRHSRLPWPLAAWRLPSGLVPHTRSDLGSFLMSQRQDRAPILWRGLAEGGMRGPHHPPQRPPTEAWVRTFRELRANKVLF